MIQGSTNAERLHIAFFGARNAGKSSLVNAVTSQEMSIVSPTPGTTTDPVKKAMELLPIGPVLIIDTPGFDDEGELGEKRVERTEEILAQTDVAVLVVDSQKEFSPEDNLLIQKFSEKNIPFLKVKSKCELSSKKDETFDGLYVSAKTGENISSLKESIALLAKKITETKREFIGDIVHEGETVILVIPTDAAAPKDRIILPQQMAVRSIIDRNAMPYVCNVNTLPLALKTLSVPPALVITDSQAFREVNELLPKEIPLTSFSILMAQYKGTLEQSVVGAKKIDELKDGDTVLISEGCTHHRQCGDIGTVKLPLALKKHTGKKLNFEFTSGGTFPKDLSPYSLIIHCGGCMLNEREMQSRLCSATEQKIPMTNYGMALALCNGILARSLFFYQ